MKRKVVYLQDNMLDANEIVIFEADIPYQVNHKNSIVNEDGIKVPINHIWVDFHVVYQAQEGYKGHEASIRFVN